MMKKLALSIAGIAFVLGTVACGGGAPKAEDAAGADGAEPTKKMEKFEGNRMERKKDQAEEE